MCDNGVRVQRFFVASTANEALEAAKRLSKLIYNRRNMLAQMNEFMGSDFPLMKFLCWELYQHGHM